MLVVGVRRACIGPTAARRLTEGRSLPGDSTLVCAAYHQFPLILNRIQRTKPARPRPATPRRPPDVYIGIEAQELAVYWVSPLHALLFAGESICFPLCRRNSATMIVVFNFPYVLREVYRILAVEEL